MNDLITNTIVKHKYTNKNVYMHNFWPDSLSDRVMTVSGHESGKDYSSHAYNSSRLKHKSHKRVATAATSLLLSCKYGGHNEEEVRVFKYYL